MRQTTLLLLTVVLGCAPQTSFISTANDSLSFRLIATTTDDPDLVRDAETQTGRLVKKDGRTIGQWVPVANSSPAATHYRELADAVTRSTDGGQEILVAYSDSDLTDIDISQLVDGGTDRNGRPTIIVHLDDADSKIFFSMTTDNVGRNLAVIADGEVKAIPKIVSPIRKEIVLTPTTIDKVRVLQ